MRKRSSYRPRPVIRNTMAYVAAGMVPPSDALQQKVQIINHGSLHSLTHGRGALDDWNNLSIAMHLALVICDQGTGDEYRHLVLDGLKAHNKCGIRRLQGKNWGYGGLELQAVSLAMEVHDAQIPLLTVREWERAHYAAIKNLEKGALPYELEAT